MKTRLLLTVALFAGWLGYLAYQVATRPKVQIDAETALPLVVSHPQALASEVDVVAQLPAPRAGEVQVEVLRVLSPSKEAPVQEGEKITVTNLGECRPSGHLQGSAPSDWLREGPHLLLLRRAGKGLYEVTPIPPSPGYLGGNLAGGPPRLYPATEQALALYHQIRKAAP
jgi:hypothetical protein